MADKYEPLTKHLRHAFNSSNVFELVLSVEEISKIVNQLPASAKKASWWANTCKPDTPLPHVKAWKDAGCYVESATPKDNVSSVTFHRGGSNHGNGFLAAKPQDAIPHGPFVLNWSWQPIGNLERSSLSKHPKAKLEIQIPEPPNCGGVYCFQFDLSGPHSYVGQTDNLRRRLLQYRSATGSTERHVEAALHGAFDSGNTPELLVITSATASLGQQNESWDIDMTDDLSLVLLEHAAIACEKRSGRTVINRIRQSQNK